MLQGEKVDLITCNPPWVTANHLFGGVNNTTFDMDNAIYDPKEQFLISSLNFCKFHLDQNGHMLLIYSDFAYNLGVQDANRVEKLCKLFGMQCELVDSTSMPLSKNLHDPLKMVKK